MGSECAALRSMRGVGPHPALFGFREQRPRLPTHYRDTLSPMGKHSPQKGRPGTWKSTGGYQGRTRHTERCGSHETCYHENRVLISTGSLLKNILRMSYPKIYRVPAYKQGCRQKWWGQIGDGGLIKSIYGLLQAAYMHILYAKSAPERTLFSLGPVSYEKRTHRDLLTYITNFKGLSVICMCILHLHPKLETITDLFAITYIANSQQLPYRSVLPLYYSVKSFWKPEYTSSF